ncbi:HAD family hydrolase [Halobaculum lipolyticum]|uniref:HAD family hydrolase n=1 Tax=Halobaculum lipolyticum TaxID=3032001 RepID=A0ABD5W9B3_9EURY|nr:HAD family hydrolase [Halobaculum sp. DT31]
MTLYDRLYELYAEFDTETLRAYREFVDLFPPLDSRVALDRWDEANADLTERRDRIERAFAGPDGAALAEVAAMADRESAFTALDLHGKHGRAPNALVLDVDETLRSAGDTDNEIPRETLHLLTEFAEASGVPLVICTGQTLENVKGFLIQGLGNELVHSGDVSVVYEAGAGVFTPGSGADTKRLLYDELDDDVRGVVDRVRDGVLHEAPDRVRRGCHLQGNEFNVTLKPNYETGSDDAEAVIDEAMVHLLDLVGVAAGERLGLDDGPAAARAYYADADPEIAGAIDRAGAAADGDVPEAAATLFDRLEVALYRADAAELAAADLHKAAGVEASLDVLGVDDPFVCVMGDSKSDLRVMEWAAANDAGVAAAPEHSSANVLDHVRATDDLVFAPGAAADVLRTMYAWRCLADLNRDAA